LAAIDVHVHHSERQDLRNAGPRVVKEQKEKVISLTSPTAIGRGQDGFDFLLVDKTNQSLDVPLEWDAGDPRHRHGQFRAEPVAQVMDKGANSRQPRIPGPDAVAALPFQVLQELNNDIGSQNVERQRETTSGVGLLEIPK